MRHAGCALGGRAREEGEGRRLHRPLRDQPGQRRGDPDLGRRLRADGVRDGRDHGRPRPRRARLRVRGEVRAADPHGREARRRRCARGRRVLRAPENEVLVNSDRFDGLPAPEAKKAIVDWLAEHGLRRRRRSATACATGCSRASATGERRSRSSTARLRPRAGPGRPVAGGAARGRGVPAEGPLSAGGGGGLGQRRVPELRRPGEARDGHDGHLRRLLLVLHPLHAIRGTTRSRSRARSRTTGCPSTSTSAASSTRSCTCSTRASSRR